MTAEERRKKKEEEKAKVEEVSDQTGDPYFQNKRKQKPENYIKQFSILSMTGYTSFHSN